MVTRIVEIRFLSDCTQCHACPTLLYEIPASARIYLLKLRVLGFFAFLQSQKLQAHDAEIT